jgi:post-segregation antitoxin (ccd killing protein)
MSRRRIYDLARAEGIPSRELVERLREAGLDVSVAVSTVDEDEARAALRRGAESNGKRENGRAAMQGSAPDAGGPWFWLKTTALALVGREVDGSARWPPVVKDEDPRLKSAADPRARPGAEFPRPRTWARRGDRRRIIVVAGVTAAVATAVLLGALLLGGSSGRSAPKRTAAKPEGRVDPVAQLLAEPYTSVVATARGPRTAVYSRPDAHTPIKRLSNPNLDGAPLVFLVKAKLGSWLQVYLPSRPNGSVGWIRASRVTFSAHQYRILIELRRHALTVWRGPRVIVRTPIGVGHAFTPTPAGRYYVTELLKQPEGDGPYGPYAFGLSLHSDVLHEFAGRDGVLGMHGTDEPDTVGTSVSHGCVRMSNRVVTELAQIIPAGTPVRIKRS